MREDTFRSECRGPSRRDVLRLGVLGSLGLGIDDLFRLRAHAAATDPRAGRASSAILIWLAGGPSHIDTFDPKPTAPVDVKGEFKPIASRIPGISLSEVLPKIAASLDRFTLVRSVTSPEADHDRAAHHLMTGYRPTPAIVYPSYGSVISRVLVDRPTALPNYVAIPDAPPFSSSGYLTQAYDPFTVMGDPNQPGFRVRDLSPPDRLTLDRLNRRRGMIRRLDRFAGEVGETSLTVSRDRFIDRAYDLLTSSAAQAAFRIDDEPAANRDRYGRTTLGQSCLLARRLVEAGVPFITVNDGGMGRLGWDTHAANFKTIKDTLAPALDQSVSALVSDLIERGLLDSTLVIVMGEFGRTPKINGNAGRDHHGRANSVLLAGGGIPRGLVVGSTDEKGAAPTHRAVTPADLAATFYTALGIDPSRQFETPDGRPIRLVEKGEAIKELTA